PCTQGAGGIPHLVWPAAPSAAGDPGPRPAPPPAAPRAPSRPLPDAQPHARQRVPPSAAAAPRAAGGPPSSPDVVSALSSDGGRRPLRLPPRLPARPGFLPEEVDADEQQLHCHPISALRSGPDPVPGAPARRLRVRAPAGS